MKKVFQKLVSTVLATVVAASSLMFAPTATFAASVSMTAGGWFETLYAELNVDESKVTAVSYSGTASGSLSGDDLTYLVRNDSNGNTRIDIPGLTAGTYNLSVTAGGSTYTQNNIKVYEYDRTGYAHADAKAAGSTGVGAYKDDGTPKDNAVIVYVTEENKNTVQVPGYTGDNYPKGIGNILNYKSDDENGVTGGGKTDVIKKLRDSNKPLIVRFLGTVIAGDENTRDDPPKVNVLGLTQYNGTGNGGTAGDDGMVARIYKSKNVTIEGIGTDAMIDGWGFQFISQTGYVTENVEVRNLSFQTTPEDAIGLEGTANLSSTTQSKEWLDNSNTPIKFSWVHNCTFYTGYCKNPTDSDKSEGDGSLDFKRGYGYTQSYNHYVKNHKTNLVGSSAKSIQYDVTFHHNYYEEVMARQPLTRQANVHIYNSYFKNGDDTSYIISPRAYSYVLSEANYYDACKNPVSAAKEGSAWVKSYNDNFAACTGTNAATIVTNKAQSVGADNPYKSDFDTEGSFPYEYEPTDAVQAKADCIALAGVMKSSDEINMEPEKESTIDSDYMPTAAISLPYTLDCTQTLAAGKYTIDNAVVNLPYKGSGTYFKIRSYGVVFTVAQEADVTFTSGSSSAYGMTLLDEYGLAVTSIATSGTTTVTVPAGTYVLQSGNTAKDAYLEQFKVVAHDPNATTSETSTKVESTTESTTKTVESTTESTTLSTDDEDYDYSGKVFVWNNTTGENTENFFYVDANDWSNAVEVTYNGMTLTEAVKMESSTDIHFTSGVDGKLYVYTYSTASKPTLNINDDKETVSSNGINVFDVGSNSTFSISKGSSSTYIYYMKFVPSETVTTEATTQTTTEGETQSTTSEQSTESTTQKQEETTNSNSVKLSVVSVDTVVGENVYLPINVESNSEIGGYIVAVKLGDGLEYVDSTNEVADNDVKIATYADGQSVAFAYVGNVNSNGKLLTLSLKADKAGTYPVTVITQAVVDRSANDLAVATNTDGSVTVTGVLATGSGDVYKDGVIDEKDAAYLMKYISGIEITDEKFNIEEGNCDGKGTQPDMLDVLWILNNMTSSILPITEKYTLTPTLLSGNEYFVQTGDFSDSTSKRIRLYSDNSLKFTVAKGAKVYVTATHASSSATSDRTLTLKDSEGKSVGTITYKQSAKATKTLLADNLEGTYVLTADNHINITSISIEF